MCGSRGNGSEDTCTGSQLFSSRLLSDCDDRNVSNTSMTSPLTKIMFTSRSDLFYSTNVLNAPGGHGRYSCSGFLVFPERKKARTIACAPYGMKKRLMVSNSPVPLAMSEIISFKCSDVLYKTRISMHFKWDLGFSIIPGISIRESL